MSNLDNIDGMNNIYKQDIKQLVQGSELIGYNPEISNQFLEVMRHCKGISTAFEFIWNIVQNPEVRVPQNGIVLGLGETEHGVDVTRRLVKGKDYYDGYKAVGLIPLTANVTTEEFLERITNLDNNYNIIFLVPENLFSHQNAGLTAREMRYFLNNPEKTANVHFVFGMHSILSPEKLENIYKNVQSSYERAVLTFFELNRVLKAIDHKKSIEYKAY